MPAGLGPASLGVYGCMGDNARFSVFLVPHSTFCLQNGTVKSYRSSPTLPGLEHFHQMAPQQADLLGKPLGQSLKTPLWKVRLVGKRPCSRRSWRTILISGVGSSRTAKSSPTLCSLLRIMITSAFIKSFSE
jgi:hypothetical protein